MKTFVIFVNKLKYQFVPEGDDVITYGDYGDKFYICLSGKVSVLIPMDHSKVIKRVQKMTKATATPDDKGKLIKNDENFGK